MPFILDNLEVYLLSEQIGDAIWHKVIKWPLFSKNGIGKQLTAAVDSISANIAEGYGRFFVKENINFFFYARGSLMETKSWIKKARMRNLIDDKEYHLWSEELEVIHKKLNGYIKVLKQNASK